MITDCMAHAEVDAEIKIIIMLCRKNNSLPIESEFLASNCTCCLSDKLVRQRELNLELQTSQSHEPNVQSVRVCS